MNWFKKQMNKILYTDEEYDAYEQENGQYEQYEQPQQAKKAAFRFPLIADEEVIEKKSTPQPQQQTNRVETNNSTFELPKYLQGEPEVYDVEVSGIRELLARRKKSKGQTNIYKSQPQEHRNHSTREEKDFLMPTKAHAKNEPKQTTVNPLQNRRRFIPTDVPSPVYGFGKPKPIEQLLPKKEQVRVEEIEQFIAQEEMPVLEQQQEVAATIEQPSLATIELFEDGQAPQPVEVNTSEYKDIEQPPIMEEQEEFDLLNELKVENLTIENSTIHIGQLHVEQAPQKEVTSGSRLPFNVLMLKSDKQKQLAKEFVKQHLQQQDVKTIKEQPAQQEELQEQLQIIEQPVELERENIAPQEVPKTLQAEPVTGIASKPHYEKPSTTFLAPPEQKTEDYDWMEQQAEALVEALSYHQVAAQVESIMQGPAVTQFEITIGQGTKVSKIRNLADDLKLALAAKDIRIQAPIPGKRTIGIEIPNLISRAVRLSEVTNSPVFKDSDSPMEAALGLDLTGKPVTLDLRKMPHGLIAGATGSGKSVCINSILVSLLYKADPNELKLMLIDPKMVELAPFNHIPHLVSPVITDVKAAAAALKWAVEEMERRYQLFMHAEVRDITRFNAIAEANGQYAQKLPYLLIVIDELADLMMMAPTDVEDAICRIAQKARACGIHLIVATQRPSVDVITGLIKANIPTRIAFAVSSQIDSRTILDIQGAERLLGRGDMLYLGNGMSAPQRIQGTFVTDDEIEEVIRYVRSQGQPDYIFEQEELLKKVETIEAQDELFEEVCRFVYEQGTVSTSSIQRKYHIGYNRAARLVEMLEGHGFVSEQRGSKPRESLITESDLENL
ncbi:DNA translocase FtsK [Lysinibacillus louembei]|uniref:DNA translocase FtsK n=1 Tax=Lysinibacillus louembei TaxID=1470088 RepID=A0ABZ0RUB4_9BACI|nr:DNA translocase FtsK [Lysinibacillus louembei]WPK10568.1 DNA translocase FtsK [Lysinibacillus louembei]